MGIPPVQVPLDPLLIYLLANEPGKEMQMAPVLGSLTSTLETRVEILAPGFGLALPFGK